MKKETLLKIGFSNFVNVEKYQKKSPDVDAKNKKMQKCEESEQNSEKNWVEDKTKLGIWL